MGLKTAILLTSALLSTRFRVAAISLPRHTIMRRAGTPPAPPSIAEPTLLEVDANVNSHASPHYVLDWSRYHQTFAGHAIEPIFDNNVLQEGKVIPFYLRIYSLRAARE